MSVRLRANNPDCQIYTSHHAGGWAAFRARVDSTPGVIIIHETLAWSLRLFPNLSRYLIHRSDEYWCLSEPVHALPLYPSIPRPEHSVAPGDIHMTRLFPFRSAILLTPSFLVSEPRRTFEFLDWFMSKWMGQFRYRLVAAHNIHEYLLELADEKYTERQAILDRYGDADYGIEEDKDGLSRDDCRLRYEAANLAAEMHMIRTVKAGPYAHDEDQSSLVYADPSIDPNDEQSLVNWFGWWATLRADQFRKFYVVGSSHAIKAPESKRGERLVRIPKYTKVTINDPDAVMEVIQERNDQLERSESQACGDTSPQAPEDNESASEKRPWSFRSDFIRPEDSSSITAYLDEVCSIPGRHLWVLYKFPVSWLNFDMAEHFHDFRTNFRRISDWFSFAKPFGGCGGPREAFNTYLGFFYTIAEEWDPDKPPECRSSNRHPWIAIYRPVNPHKKPYSRCEVIIWDPAARTKFKSQHNLTERDLLFMQRQLIQHVREYGDQKNFGTWVDRVWLGGFEWPSDCNSPYPLDVTLLFLRKMVGNIRDFLPAPEHVMEAKGFRKVLSDAAADQSIRSPATSTSGSALFVDEGPGTEAMSAGLDGAESSEEDEDARVIFHPPRGTKRPGKGAPSRSRCRNRLYEEARLARARAEPGTPPPTHMRYRFVPTAEWYREQRAEGRGYAHLNVDAWEPIFNRLRIGEGAESTNKTANANATRRESTASG